MWYFCVYFITRKYRRGRNCVFVFLVAILDAILNMIILQFAKICNITSLQDLIKIQTKIHFQIIDSIVGNLYLVDILDAILNF